MRLPDFWTGLAFGVLGLIIAIIARGFPVPAGAASPRLFPTIIGAGLTIMGAAIAFRGFRYTTGITLPEWYEKPRRIALMAFLPIAVIVFALAAPLFGTIAVSVPLLIAHCLIYGLRLMKSIVIGLIAGSAIPLIFTDLLGIPLPYGIVEELF